MREGGCGRQSRQGSEGGPTAHFQPLVLGFHKKTVIQIFIRNFLGFLNVGN